MRKYLFMIAYYGASAVYQGYMSLFYEGIGLNRAQIGAVNAAAAVSALAAQPLWGAAGDRVKRRKVLLCAVACMSALILPAALPKSEFFAQIVASAGFFAFYSALLPLGDAVILSSEEKRIYGRIRLSGGVSYAVFSLLGGWLIGLSDAKYALWLTSAMLLCAAISALFLPEKAKEKAHTRFLPALKDGELRALLLFMLPSQIAMGFFYAFFALHFMSLSKASHILLGVANLISALAEIPYLALGDRIYERFGAGKTMLAATAALSFRFFLLGTCKNAYVALASQILNGIGYIAVGVSMAKYIGQRLPENAAAGQSLISLLFYGASRLIGSLLGGFIAQRLGVGKVFGMISALCALSVTAFYIYMKRKRLRI